MHPQLSRDAFIAGRPRNGTSLRLVIHRSPGLARSVSSAESRLLRILQASQGRMLHWLVLQVRDVPGFLAVVRKLLPQLSPPRPRGGVPGVGWAALQATAAPLHVLQEVETIPLEFPVLELSGTGVTLE